jgi:hypothetical protein
MLEKRTVELYFNLGGQGLVSTTTTAPTVSGTVDNLGNRVDYTLTGKFATLEIEVYDIAQFQYPSLTGTLDSVLPFEFGNTTYIFRDITTRQNEGTIRQSNNYTDTVDIVVYNADGSVIFDIPVVTYSAANIEGSTGSTPDILIAYLPILQGAILTNPSDMQVISQSYGSYTLSSGFTISATNSQGSTFAIAPTVTSPSAQNILTSDVTFNISLGAANDGNSIFGTYVVPKVFTYPDGSTIPSQKQTWTI